MARLANAPVCFTLAQMRFNPVLDMGAIIPSLQGAFLKIGFPDFEESRVQGIELQQGADGFSVNQRSVLRFVFRSRERTAALVLDSDALTFELTDYPVFEDFSRSFLTALSIVHDHRPIEYCDRLGMRMLDVIQPVGTETLDQYVQPQALGFLGLAATELEHKHTLTESLFQQGARTLLIRTLRSSQGLAVPPDLAPLRLNIAPKFLEHQGESLMLDTDSFQGERTDFSFDSTMDHLRQLKCELSASFKAVVTPHALQMWA